MAESVRNPLQELLIGPSWDHLLDLPEFPSAERREPWQSPSLPHRASSLSLGRAACQGGSGGHSSRSLGKQCRCAFPFAGALAGGLFAPARQKEAAFRLP